ncbi:hypothetical protein [Paracidovorax valerianellae]|uniref:Uncharacterized protein n=1 Tax=Paracidovorax valerianellae TaxID=187868 RepID=A0A1G7A5M0_9BURK|nr:hypothetical protein [Paracidovorax valerianellae]MDA8443737.1 hypothetical protein [Paracidovorax valerianellae]SDE10139.1 hypothetical protein SAMN05192589_11273 [Paracidovorax valerianellae]
MAHIPAPTLRPRCAALLVLLLLSGCEIPGLGPDPRAVQKEAEAKAIGGACRHALRGLEDCFTLNPKAAKASVFAGWKDMDQYMRDNKLEGAPSVLGKLETKPERASKSGEAAESGEAGTGSRNRS